MDSFETQVDIRSREKKEPETCLGPADIGDRTIFSPLVDKTTIGIAHVGVAEITFFHRQAQGRKRPGRNGHLVHLRCDDLEDAGFQDTVGVVGKNLRDLQLCPGKVSHQIGFASP